jgi:hypothetical protein
VSLEWILFGLRLLATTILYVFLAVAFYLIWRQLRQTETQQTSSSGVKVDQLRVISITGDQDLVEGQLLPLQPALILGRDADNKVIINPANSLPAQVRLSRERDQWQLVNLGQPDQIKLNDLFISEPQSLSDGDVISIGDTQFRFETAK